jgi:hypothetical protein
MILRRDQNGNHFGLPNEITAKTIAKTRGLSKCIPLSTAPFSITVAPAKHKIFPHVLRPLPDFSTEHIHFFKLPVDRMFLLAVLAAAKDEIETWDIVGVALGGGAIVIGAVVIIVGNFCRRAKEAKVNRQGTAEVKRVLRDPVSKYPPDLNAEFVTMERGIGSLETERQSRLAAPPQGLVQTSPASMVVR